MRSLFIGLALAAPFPALAQSSRTGPALEQLIPDSAVADPDAWVKDSAPPAEPAQPAESPEAEVAAPDSPLAEDGFTLPWPGDEPVESAALDPVEPDGELADVLPEPAEAQASAGQAHQVSRRVAIVWPASLADFPELPEFERRFRALSAIEQYKGQGDAARRDGAQADDDGDVASAQLAVRARTDAALLARMLRVYGFYDAEVSQTIAAIQPGETAAEGGAQVRFEILPGTRYRFGAIDLGRLDAAGADAPQLRAAFRIATGDPLSSDRIVAERSRLDEALGEGGFAFARIGDPALTIDHRREQGDLALPVEPGGKYRFGAIASNREKFFSSRHIAEIARFDSGDGYRRSEVDDLRRAILATGLVSSVGITPRETRAPADGAPGEVALDVALEKAPLRTIAGAVGYDTGEGPRAELSWEHRNLFPPEGLLRVRAVGGLNEQLAGVTFRRNNFRGRDRVLSLDLIADKVSRQAYGARTLSFAGSFERVTTLLFQKPWTWAAGFELVASSEREAKVKNVPTPRRSYYTAALPLRAAYDGSDNLLDPTRGFRAALRVSPEVSRRANREVTYARVQLDASAYQPLGGTVLAARVRLGSIAGAPLADIAPSRRFYAGGGGSVRGFGYQQIGPRDTAGEPSGGRSLSEFSLEARVGTGFLGGALALVPFVDAGAVDEGPTPRLRDLRLGAGIGFRYKTTFGPIRVDLGTPLNRRKGESRIAISVALGQAF